MAGISRFPVKSMRGERLNEAELRWTGLRGDREYALVLEDRLRRFPWATGRELPDLLLYAARGAGDYAPSGLPVIVATPNGRELAVGDQALLAEIEARLARPVRLMQISRGAHDAMPLSILSTATVRAIETSHGAPVSDTRFRMNVLIEAEERDPAWRGGALLFGSDGPLVAVTRPVERCVMITLDPSTAERDPALMRTVAQAFGNEVGEYASVLRPGILRVGDEVRLMSLPA